MLASGVAYTSALDGEILSPDLNRIGLTIYNEGDGDVLIQLGTGVSLTQYTTKIIKDAYYETPYKYTGQIELFSTVTPTVRITKIAE